MPVIKQTRRVIVGPVGINRQSRAGEIENNALSELAGNISSIAFKNAADYADKKGIEAAQAADQATITTIDPVTKRPEAMNIPKGFGTIAAESYERIIRGRYEDSIKNLIANKAAILEDQYQYTANPIKGFQTNMKSFVEGLTSDFGEDQNSFKSAIIDYGQKYTDNGATRLTIKKADRDRAALAASIATKLANWETVATSQIAAGGVAAWRKINNIENIDTNEIKSLSLNADNAGLNEHNVKNERFSSQAKTANDKAGAVGLLSNIATRLTGSSLTLYEKWLASGGNMPLATLPIEVQNEINNVKILMQSEALVLQHAKDAQPIVKEILDSATVITEAKSKAATSDVNKTTAIIGDYTNTAVQSPSDQRATINNLKLVAGDLNKHHDNLIRGEITGPEFSTLNKGVGEFISKAFINLVNSNLDNGNLSIEGKSVNLGSEEDINSLLDTLQEPNAIDALLRIDGIPKTGELPDAIRKAYMNLNEDGRDQFVTEMGSYFSALARTGKRTKELARSQAQNSIVDSIYNFNKEEFTDQFSLNSKRKDILKQINESYDPAGVSTQTKNLNQAFLSDALSRIDVVSKEEIMAIAKELSGNGPFIIDGKPVKITKATLSLVNNIKEQLGNDALLETALQTTINTWKTRVSGEQVIRDTALSDQQDIALTASQTEANFSINQISTATNIGAAEAYANEARSIINAMPSDTPEQVAGIAALEKKITNGLGKAALAESLRGLSVEELNQVKAGTKPPSLADSKYNRIQEAMTNKSITDENRNDVLTSKLTEAKLDLANRKENESVQRFARELQTGNLTPTPENKARLKIEFQKQWGVNLDDYTAVAPFLAEIASGKINSNEAIALDSVLNQVMPQPLLDAFNLIVSGGDSQAMRNVNFQDAVTLWNKYSYRIDSTNKKIYSTALRLDGTLEPRTIETMNSISKMQALGYPPERVNGMINYQIEAGANLQELNNTQALRFEFDSIPSMLSKKLPDEIFNIYNSVLTPQDQAAINNDVAAQIYSGVTSLKGILEDVKTRISAKIIQDPFTMSPIEGVNYTLSGITQIHSSNQANNIVIKNADAKLRALYPNYGLTVRTLLPDGKIPTGNKLWVEENSYWQDFKETAGTIADYVFFRSPTLTADQMAARESERDRIMFVELPEGTAARPIYGFVKVDTYGNKDPIMVGNNILKFDPYSDEIMDEILVSQTVFGERSKQEKGIIESAVDLWWSLDPNPAQKGF